MRSAQTSESSEGAVKTASRPATRLLLVEDDPHFAELLSMYLQRSSCEVTWTQSAEEAIATLAAHTPDLAVVDIGLPGASGLELARVLRDQFAVPFAFVTGAGDDRSIEEARTLGALAYIAKSSGIRECLAGIRVAADRAAELRRLRERETHLTLALQQTRHVSMAIGLLMERLRLDREAAFARLREEARSARQPIAGLAEELLSSAERLNRLARQPAPHKRLPDA